MSVVRVRRANAAFFSGWKSHPTNFLLPEAVRAVMEVSKRLKLLVILVTLTDPGNIWELPIWAGPGPRCCTAAGLNALSPVTNIAEHQNWPEQLEFVAPHEAVFGQVRKKNC